MTYQTAIDYLRKLFSGISGDSISVEEAYKAGGRNLENVETNKVWLRNKLTYLKRYNLVKPIYAQVTHHEILEFIKLTEEGKRALASKLNDKKDDSSPVLQEVLDKKRDTSLENAKNIVISLADITGMIKMLKEQSPESKITIDFVLGEGIVSIRMA